MKLLALFISRLFEPMVVLTIATIAGAFHADLTAADLRIFLFLLVFVMLLPTLVYRWWIVKTKRVGDWDIHERKKRIGPLLALLIFVSVQTFFVTGLGNKTLIDLFIIYSAWMVGFFLITLFWKISGHVGAAALAAGLLVQWYGWGWWPVLLAVPLVAWARVVGRDHTLAQAVGGALYSLVVLLGTLRVNG